MTTQNIDILCVNTQTQLGLDSKKLVRLSRQGDIGTLHYAISHIAMHNLMRALKGTKSGDITETQYRKAEANIVKLKKTLENY